MRQEAIELHTNGRLGYGEIRKRLGASKSTLSYWLREFPLSEEKILKLRQQGRQKGEASRERFRATMRRKQKLKSQEVYEQQIEKLSKVSDAFL